MKAALVVLIPLALPFLWVGIIVPLVARVLGVPMKTGLWRYDRKNRHLTNSQYMWAVGVFGFGGGMFLMNLTSRYVDWRLWGYEWHHPSAIRVILELAWALGAGLSFGLLTVHHRKTPE